MRIAMKSILTGNITTRHIPVTHGQIMRWRDGVSIQKALQERKSPQVIPPKKGNKAVRNRKKEKQDAIRDNEL